jgi:hypothetical protein
MHRQAFFVRIKKSREGTTIRIFDLRFEYVTTRGEIIFKFNNSNLHLVAFSCFLITGTANASIDMTPGKDTDSSHNAALLLSLVYEHDHTAEVLL